MDTWRQIIKEGVFMQTKKHTRSHVPVRQILDSLGLGGLSGHWLKLEEKDIYFTGQRKDRNKYINFPLKRFHQIYVKCFNRVCPAENLILKYSPKISSSPLEIQIFINFARMYSVESSIFNHFRYEEHNLHDLIQHIYTYPIKTLEIKEKKSNDSMKVTKTQIKTN